MNTHFICVRRGSGKLPESFIQKWRELFPSDELKDVTNRQVDKDDMDQSVEQYDQLIMLIHDCDIHNADAKKAVVKAKVGIDHKVEIGIAREISLSEEIPLVHSMGDIPKNVFGPSSAQKPRTYMRGGVRHVG